MKNTRFLTLVLLGSLFFSTPVFALDATPSAPTEQPSTNKVFNAKTYALENGMKIVVVENKRAPVLTHMVWYRVGAADEKAGKSGIAHFLEHLMFKGQKNLEPGQFSKIIRSLGGQDNAFTSQDYTAYYQSVAKEHLETVMMMEAGRMRDMSPPLSEVESENKVIQEERRQRTDNDPRAQMAEQLNYALFPNHPYGMPVIGWLHEIQGLSWDDAKSFYDQYYAPNNAILVVSGDVDADKVHEIAKTTYGTLPKGDIPQRVRTTSPPFIAQDTIYLSHETIKEPVFVRSYRVASYRQAPEDSLALQVLEQILSGGSTSRLYDALVVKQKIATNAALSYDPNSWDDATIDVMATPAPGVPIIKVQDALQDQLRLVIKDGVSDGELADAIKTMQADAIYALDSLDGPAMILGRTLITGTPLEDIEDWPQRIATVTKEQIQAVAAKYLDPDNLYMHPPVTGFLLPKDAKESK